MTRAHPPRYRLPPFLKISAAFSGQLHNIGLIQIEVARNLLKLALPPPTFLAA
jgi:hypothetical protein